MSGIVTEQAPLVALVKSGVGFGKTDDWTG